MNRPDSPVSGTSRLGSEEEEIAAFSSITLNSLCSWKLIFGLYISHFRAYLFIVIDRAHKDDALAIVITASNPAELKMVRAWHKFYN